MEGQDAETEWPREQAFHPCLKPKIWSSIVGVGLPALGDGGRWLWLGVGNKQRGER